MGRAQCNIPPSRVRVLLTNNTLAARAGTELYVRDVALALLARGHSPIAYSATLGAVADELRAATVPVVDDLRSITAAPDVIHGQHHLETMTALLHFDSAPALLYCHGWLPWQERPVVFPRIYRYVAVDELCRERLVIEHAIPDARVRVLLNFVDLTRFTPRDPLPARPRRALVFSNNASDASFVPIVRSACAQAGLALDVMGAAAGHVQARPEVVLRDYDLVFAKARSALEALAVGCAVILCDLAGSGPLVTTAEVDQLRALNFGIRTLQQPIAVDTLAREIARYDAADATEVSRRIRVSAGQDTAIEQLIAFYDDVRADHAAAGPSDRHAESRAAADYLRSLAPRVKDHDRLWTERDRVASERDALAARVAQLETSLPMRARRRILQVPGLAGLARSAARFLRR